MHDPPPAGALERTLLAAAAFFATAALGYAALRCGEVAFFVEANPAALVDASRSPFLWRCGIAVYMGGLGAFGGHALAGRAPDVAARWIARGAVIAAIAIAAQGVLLP